VKPQTLVTAREMSTRWGVNYSYARRLLAQLNPVATRPTSRKGKPCHLYDEAEAQTVWDTRPGRGVPVRQFPVRGRRTR
jgi:hypothetical protein